MASAAVEAPRLAHSVTAQGASEQPHQEPAQQPRNEPAATTTTTASTTSTTTTAAKGPSSRGAGDGARAQGPLHHALSRELDDDVAAAFSCHICLELAHQPVVTLCGHLFCWPCLYRWAQVQSACRQCPVCKAGVDIDRVIPIYGRGQETTQRGADKAGSPGHAADAHGKPAVPPRPAGQRLPAVVQGSAPGGAPQPAAQLSGQAPAQQGVLPALFGFQLGPGQGYVEALTPEQQHQAFLSRLLLMLGSFVIMCLLLF